MKKQPQHYEHVEGMSREFADFTGNWGDRLTPWETWSLRIGLAIAQQLSVIAGALKDRNKPDKEYEERVMAHARRLAEREG